MLCFFLDTLYTIQYNTQSPTIQYVRTHYIQYTVTYYTIYQNTLYTIHSHLLYNILGHTIYNTLYNKQYIGRIIQCLVHTLQYMVYDSLYLHRRHFTINRIHSQTGHYTTYTLFLFYNNQVILLRLSCSQLFGVVNFLWK